MAEKFVWLESPWLLHLTSTQANWSYLELSWVKLGLGAGFWQYPCLSGWRKITWVYAVATFQWLGGAWWWCWWWCWWWAPLTQICVTFSQFQAKHGKMQHRSLLFLSKTPGFRPDLLNKREGEGIFRLFWYDLICSLKCDQQLFLMAGFKITTKSLSAYYSSQLSGSYASKF